MTNAFSTNSDPWNPNSGFGNMWNAPSAIPKPSSLFEVSPLPTFSNFLREEEKPRNPFDVNDSGVTRISRTRPDSYRSIEEQDEYEPPPKLSADDFQRMYRRDMNFGRPDDDALESAVIDYGHGASNDIPDDDDMLKYVRREEAGTFDDNAVADDDDDDRVKDCVTIDYGHGASVTIVDTGFRIPPMDDEVPPHPSKHSFYCQAL